jgi:hypothetical protein
VLTPRKVHGEEILRRFWIHLASDQSASDQSPLGYGVTAFDREDALSLLRDRVFSGRLPQIESIVEDVDVSTLDEAHVRPNMEAPAFRGVWFPRGYASSSG